MSVAKGSDDLWVGVKCQSNAEIAGSPRNVLRYSRRARPVEVEHCCCAGASPLTKRRQTPNATVLFPASETMRANMQRREGNNPDPLLRSPSYG